MAVTSIAIPFLIAVSVGGLAWVFLYPILSGEKAMEKRQSAVAVSKVKVSKGQLRNKREQVEEALSEIERKQKAVKNPPISVQLVQAGLTWTKRQFIFGSLWLGAFTGFIVYGIVGSPLVALGAAFAAALGLPRFVLSFMKKRRMGKFLNEFPNAVDVIVRGVKAGLPLGDCLRIIAHESQEPVRDEFRQALETQAIGMPIPDAVAKIYERMPVAEANFFSIVVSIQQKSGGNLADVLGNLSRVIRDRKKMRAKIQAMSSEAKTSAAIIGSLPIIMIAMIHLTTPGYIDILFETDKGRFIVACCIGWMLAGVLVMRKMINFDF